MLILGIESSCDETGVALVGTGTGPDDFGLKGIALCAVVAIALNLILPGNDSWKHKKKGDGPVI